MSWRSLQNMPQQNEKKNVIPATHEIYVNE